MFYEAEHLFSPEDRAQRIAMLREIRETCRPGEAVKWDIITRRIWLITEELPWPITEDDEAIYIMMREPLPLHLIATPARTMTRTRRGRSVPIHENDFTEIADASVMGGW